MKALALWIVAFATLANAIEITSVLPTSRSESTLSLEKPLQISLFDNNQNKENEKKREHKPIRRDESFPKTFIQKGPKRLSKLKNNRHQSSDISGQDHTKNMNKEQMEELSNKAVFNFLGPHQLLASQGKNFEHFESSRKSSKLQQRFLNQHSNFEIPTAHKGSIINIGMLRKKKKNTSNINIDKEYTASENLKMEPYTRSRKTMKFVIHKHRNLFPKGVKGSLSSIVNENDNSVTSTLTTRSSSFYNTGRIILQKNRDKSETQTHNNNINTDRPKPRITIIKIKPTHKWHSNSKMILGKTLHNYLKHNDKTNQETYTNQDRKIIEDRRKKLVSDVNLGVSKHWNHVNKIRHKQSAEEQMKIKEPTKIQPLVDVNLSIGEGIKRRDIRTDVTKLNNDGLKNTPKIIKTKEIMDIDLNIALRNDSKIDNVLLARQSGKDISMKMVEVKQKCKDYSLFNERKNQFNYIDTDASDEELINTKENNRRSIIGEQKHMIVDDVSNTYKDHTIESFKSKDINQDKTDNEKRSIREKQRRYDIRERKNEKKVKAMMNGNIKETINKYERKEEFFNTKESRFQDSKHVRQDKAEHDERPNRKKERQNEIRERQNEEFLNSKESQFHDDISEKENSTQADEIYNGKNTVKFLKKKNSYHFQTEDGNFVKSDGNKRNQNAEKCVNQLDDGNQVQRNSFVIEHGNNIKISKSNVINHNTNEVGNESIHTKQRVAEMEDTNHSEFHKTIVNQEKSFTEEAYNNNIDQNAVQKQGTHQYKVHKQLRDVQELSLEINNHDEIIKRGIEKFDKISNESAENLEGIVHRNNHYFDKEKSDNNEIYNGTNIAKSVNKKSIKSISNYNQIHKHSENNNNTQFINAMIVSNGTNKYDQKVNTIKQRKSHNAINDENTKYYQAKIMNKNNKSHEPPQNTKESNTHYLEIDKTRNNTKYKSNKCDPIKGRLNKKQIAMKPKQTHLIIENVNEFSGAANQDQENINTNNYQKLNIDKTAENLIEKTKILEGKDPHHTDIEENFNHEPETTIIDMFTKGYNEKQVDKEKSRNLHFATERNINNKLIQLKAIDQSTNELINKSKRKIKDSKEDNNVKFDEKIVFKHRTHNNKLFISRERHTDNSSSFKENDNRQLDEKLFSTNTNTIYEDSTIRQNVHHSASEENARENVNLIDYAAEKPNKVLVEQNESHEIIKKNQTNKYYKPDIIYDGNKKNMNETETHKEDKNANIAANKIDVSKYDVKVANKQNYTPNSVNNEENRSGVVKNRNKSKLCDKFYKTSTAIKEQDTKDKNQYDNFLINNKDVPITYISNDNSVLIPNNIVVTHNKSYKSTFNKKEINDQKSINTKQKLKSIETGHNEQQDQSTVIVQHKNELDDKLVAIKHGQSRKSLIKKEKNIHENKLNTMKQKMKNSKRRQNNYLDQTTIIVQRENKLVAANQARSYDFLIKEENNTNDNKVTTSSKKKPKSIERGQNEKTDQSTIIIQRGNKIDDKLVTIKQDRSINSLIEVSTNQYRFHDSLIEEENNINDKETNSKQKRNNIGRGQNENPDKSTIIVQSGNKLYDELVATQRDQSSNYLIKEDNNINENQVSITKQKFKSIEGDYNENLDQSTIIVQSDKEFDNKVVTTNQDRTQSSHIKEEIQINGNRSTTLKQKHKSVERGHNEKLGKSSIIVQRKNELDDKVVAVKHDQFRKTFIEEENNFNKSKFSNTNRKFKSIKRDQNEKVNQSTIIVQSEIDFDNKLVATKQYQTQNSHIEEGNHKNDDKFTSTKQTIKRIERSHIGNINQSTVTVQRKNKSDNKLVASNQDSLIEEEINTNDKKVTSSKKKRKINKSGQNEKPQQSTITVQKDDDKLVDTKLDRSINSLIEEENNKKEKIFTSTKHKIKSIEKSRKEKVDQSTIKNQSENECDNKLVVTKQDRSRHSPIEDENNINKNKSTTTKQKLKSIEIGQNEKLDKNKLIVQKENEFVNKLVANNLSRSRNSLIEEENTINDNKFTNTKEKIESIKRSQNEKIHESTIVVQSENELDSTLVATNQDRYRNSVIQEENNINDKVSSAKQKRKSVEKSQNEKSDQSTIIVQSNDKLDDKLFSDKHDQSRNSLIKEERNINENKLTTTTQKFKSIERGQNVILDQNTNIVQWENECDNKLVATNQYRTKNSHIEEENNINKNKSTKTKHKIESIERSQYENLDHSTIIVQRENNSDRNSLIKEERNINENKLTTTKQKFKSIERGQNVKLDQNTNIVQWENECDNKLVATNQDRTKNSHIEEEKNINKNKSTKTKHKIESIERSQYENLDHSTIIVQRENNFDTKLVASQDRPRNSLIQEENDIIENKFTTTKHKHKSIERGKNKKLHQSTLIDQSENVFDNKLVATNHDRPRNSLIDEKSNIIDINFTNTKQKLKSVERDYNEKFDQRRLIVQSENEFVNKLVATTQKQSVHSLIEEQNKKSDNIFISTMPNLKSIESGQNEKPDQNMLIAQSDNKLDDKLVANKHDQSRNSPIEDENHKNDNRFTNTKHKIKNIERGRNEKLDQNTIIVQSKNEFDSKLVVTNPNRSRDSLIQEENNKKDEVTTAKQKRSENEKLDHSTIIVQSENEFDNKLVAIKERRPHHFLLKEENNINENKLTTTKQKHKSIERCQNKKIDQSENEFSNKLLAAKQEQSINSLIEEENNIYENVFNKEQIKSIERNENEKLGQSTILVQSENEYDSKLVATNQDRSRNSLNQEENNINDQVTSVKLKRKSIEGIRNEKLDHSTIIVQSENEFDSKFLATNQGRFRNSLIEEQSKINEKTGLNKKLDQSKLIIQSENDFSNKLVVTKQECSINSLNEENEFSSTKQKIKSIERGRNEKLDHSTIIVQIENELGNKSVVTNQGRSRNFLIEEEDDLNDNKFTKMKRKLNRIETNKNEYLHQSTIIVKSKNELDNKLVAPNQGRSHAFQIEEESNINNNNVSSSNQKRNNIERLQNEKPDKSTIIVQSDNKINSKLVAGNYPIKEDNKINENKFSTTKQNFKSIERGQNKKLDQNTLTVQSETEFDNKLIASNQDQTQNSHSNEENEINYNKFTTTKQKRIVRSKKVNLHQSTIKVQRKNELENNLVAPNQHRSYASRNEEENNTNDNKVTSSRQKLKNIEINQNEKPDKRTIIVQSDNKLEDILIDTKHDQSFNYLIKEDSNINENKLSTTKQMFKSIERGQNEKPYQSTIIVQSEREFNTKLIATNQDQTENSYSNEENDINDNIFTTTKRKLKRIERSKNENLHQSTISVQNKLVATNRDRSRNSLNEEEKNFNENISTTRKLKSIERGQNVKQDQSTIIVQSESERDNKKVATKQDRSHHFLREYENNKREEKSTTTKQKLKSFEIGQNEKLGYSSIIFEHKNEDDNKLVAIKHGQSRKTVIEEEKNIQEDKFNTTKQKFKSIEIDQHVKLDPSTLIVQSENIFDNKLVSTNQGGTQNSFIEEEENKIKDNKLTNTKQKHKSIERGQNNKLNQSTLIVQSEKEFSNKLFVNKQDRSCYSRNSSQVKNNINHNKYTNTKKNRISIERSQNEKLDHSTNIVQSENEFDNKLVATKMDGPRHILIEEESNINDNKFTNTKQNNKVFKKGRNEKLDQSTLIDHSKNELDAKLVAIKHGQSLKTLTKEEKNKHENKFNTTKEKIKCNERRENEKLRQSTITVQSENEFDNKVVASNQDRTRNSLVEEENNISDKVTIAKEKRKSNERNQNEKLDRSTIIVQIENEFDNKLVATNQDRSRHVLTEEENNINDNKLTKAKGQIKSIERSQNEKLRQSTIIVQSENELDSKLVSTKQDRSHNYLIQEEKNINDKVTRAKQKRKSVERSQNEKRDHSTIFVQSGNEYKLVATNKARSRNFHIEEEKNITDNKVTSSKQTRKSIKRGKNGKLDQATIIDKELGSKLVATNHDRSRNFLIEEESNIHEDTNLKKKIESIKSSQNENLHQNTNIYFEPVLTNQDRAHNSHIQEKNNINDNKVTSSKETLKSIERGQNEELDQAAIIIHSDNELKGNMVATKQDRSRNSFFEEQKNMNENKSTNTKQKLKSIERDQNQKLGESSIIVQRKNELEDKLVAVKDGPSRKTLNEEEYNISDNRFTRMKHNIKAIERSRNKKLDHSKVQSVNERENKLVATKQERSDHSFIEEENNVNDNEFNNTKQNVKVFEKGPNEKLDQSTLILQSENEFVDKMVAPIQDQNEKLDRSTIIVQSENQLDNKLVATKQDGICNPLIQDGYKIINTKQKHKSVERSQIKELDQSTLIVQSENERENKLVAKRSGHSLIEDENNVNDNKFNNMKQNLQVFDKGPNEKVDQSTLIVQSENEFVNKLVATIQDRNEKLDQNTIIVQSENQLNNKLVATKQGQLCNPLIGDGYKFTNTKQKHKSVESSQINKLDQSTLIVQSENEVSNILVPTKHERSINSHIEEENKISDNIFTSTMHKIKSIERGRNEKLDQSTVIVQSENQFDNKLMAINQYRSRNSPIEKEKSIKFDKEQIKDKIKDKYYNSFTRIIERDAHVSESATDSYVKFEKSYITEQSEHTSKKEINVVNSNTQKNLITDDRHNLIHRSHINKKVITKPDEYTSQHKIRTKSFHKTIEERDDDKLYKIEPGKMETIVKQSFNNIDESKNRKFDQTIDTGQLVNKYDERLLAFKQNYIHNSSFKNENIDNLLEETIEDKSLDKSSIHHFATGKNSSSEYIATNSVNDDNFESKNNVFLNVNEIVSEENHSKEKYFIDQGTELFNKKLRDVKQPYLIIKDKDNLSKPYVPNKKRHSNIKENHNSILENTSSRSLKQSNYYDFNYEDKNQSDLLSSASTDESAEESVKLFTINKKHTHKPVTGDNSKLISSTAVSHEESNKTSHNINKLFTHNYATEQNNKSEINENLEYYTVHDEIYNDKYFDASNQEDIISSQYTDKSYELATNQKHTNDFNITEVNNSRFGMSKNFDDTNNQSNENLYSNQEYNDAAHNEQNRKAGYSLLNKINDVIIQNKVKLFVNPVLGTKSHTRYSVDKESMKNKKNKNNVEESYNNFNDVNQRYVHHSVNVENNSSKIKTLVGNGNNFDKKSCNTEQNYSTKVDTQLSNEKSNDSNQTYFQNQSKNISQEKNKNYKTTFTHQEVNQKNIDNSITDANNNNKIGALPVTALETEESHVEIVVTEQKYTPHSAIEKDNNNKFDQIAIIEEGSDERNNQPLDVKQRHSENSLIHEQNYKNTDKTKINEKTLNNELHTTKRTNINDCNCNAKAMKENHKEQKSLVAQEKIREYPSQFTIKKNNSGKIKTTTVINEYSEDYREKPISKQSNTNDCVTENYEGSSNFSTIKEIDNRGIREITNASHYTNIAEETSCDTKQKHFSQNHKPKPQSEHISTQLFSGDDESTNEKVEITAKVRHPKNIFDRINKKEIRENPKKDHQEKTAGAAITEDNILYDKYEKAMEKGLRNQEDEEWRNDDDNIFYDKYEKEITKSSAHADQQFIEPDVSGNSEIASHLAKLKVPEDNKIENVDIDDVVRYISERRTNRGIKGGRLPTPSNEELKGIRYLLEDEAVLIKSYLERLLDKDNSGHCYCTCNSGQKPIFISVPKERIYNNRNRVRKIK